MTKTFTPEVLARQGKARLRAKADAKRAAGARKYFKETVEFYGVASPDVRSIAADLYATIRKDWTVNDAIRHCELMFREPELEAKALGALVMIRYKKVLPKSLFGRIKGWLAADLLNNWASVDVFCPEAVGTLLVRYPELVDEHQGLGGACEPLGAAGFDRLLPETGQERGLSRYDLRRCAFALRHEGRPHPEGRGLAPSRGREEGHGAARGLSPRERAGHPPHDPPLRHRALRS